MAGVALSMTKRRARFGCPRSRAFEVTLERLLERNAVVLDVETHPISRAYGSTPLTIHPERSISSILADSAEDARSYGAKKIPRTSGICAQRTEDLRAQHRRQ